MFFHDLISAIKQAVREFRRKQWRRARRAAIRTPFD